MRGSSYRSTSTRARARIRNGFRSGRCARSSGVKQVFPAGRDVLVEQTYTPGTGSQSTLTFGAPGLSAAEKARYRETYCTDGPFTSAVQSLYREANAPNPKVGAFEEYLSYVITSGANWAGPIGTFRLVIDKGDTTLVSFCGDGVKKIGPTTFEMTARDYTPRRDIDVLFIKTHDLKRRIAICGSLSLHLDALRLRCGGDELHRLPESVLERLGGLGVGNLGEAGGDRLGRALALVEVDAGRLADMRHREDARAGAENDCATAHPR